MKIAIIDYGAGNIRSVYNACVSLGDLSVRVVTTPGELNESDCIILPGVAAFAEGMELLRQQNFVDALNEQVMEKRKPFLGVCLGMQLLMEKSTEGGHSTGLCWLPGEVQRFDLSQNFRVPHMGWNEVSARSGDPLFDSVGEDRNFYFANSYHINCSDADAVIATCNYGYEFPVVVRKDNIVGMQFHPEKSHVNGLQLLRNFFYQAQRGEA